jgi:hypothetical protein
MYGWTSTEKPTSELRRLGGLVEGAGGKRHLFGGTESPSKRVKYAEKFMNLKAFGLEVGRGWNMKIQAQQFFKKKRTPPCRPDRNMENLLIITLIIWQVIWDWSGGGKGKVMPT